MALFDPEAGHGDPERRLFALLGAVDVLQVRIKGAGGTPSGAGPSAHWCRLALALARELPDPPLVIVNDRVDVALLLSPEGLAGVHLGEGDLPVEAARALLGADPLIGLSTHDLAAVAAAAELPVDYLGFGPVFPTATKGYEHGLGPEAAWIAAGATHLPLFPIGGITLENADALAPVGRACVGSALWNAPDPAAAAQALRTWLDPGE